VGPERGQIEAPIGRYVWDRKKMAVSPLRGREATTEYEVRTRFGVATLLELKLLTGRTHQIRVHLQHLGYPVVGDPTYGGRRRSLLVGLSQADRSRATRLLELLQRQALHAIRLGFTHPRTREHLEFNSPLPEDMSLALAFLKMPVE
jgi:23S rRNA pseudouridine1911/1915/1917 synthase